MFRWFDFFCFQLFDDMLVSRCWQGYLEPLYGQLRCSCHGELNVHNPAFLFISCYFSCCFYNYLWLCSLLHPSNQQYFFSFFFTNQKLHQDALSRKLTSKRTVAQFNFSLCREGKRFIYLSCARQPSKNRQKEHNDNKWQ